MQVSKWGNSLAIRIPASLVEALSLREGDDVELYVGADRSIELSRKPGRSELIERLRAFRDRLPPECKFEPGYRFDRDEANAR